MNDTRRVAAWYTDGWYRSGDETQTHLVDYKPPTGRAIPIWVAYPNETVQRWMLFCRFPDDPCAACNRHAELYKVEVTLRDSCCCYTTCGEICDDCSDVVNISS